MSCFCSVPYIYKRWCACLFFLLLFLLVSHWVRVRSWYGMILSLSKVSAQFKLPVLVVFFPCRRSRPWLRMHHFWEIKRRATIPKHPSSMERMNIWRTEIDLSNLESWKNIIHWLSYSDGSFFRCPLDFEASEFWHKHLQKRKWKFCLHQRNPAGILREIVFLKDCLWRKSWVSNRAVIHVSFVEQHSNKALASVQVKVALCRHWV